MFYVLINAFRHQVFWLHLLDFESREWVTETMEEESQESEGDWESAEQEADGADYRMESTCWAKEETWQRVCDQDKLGGEFVVTVHCVYMVIRCLGMCMH